MYNKEAMSELKKLLMKKFPNLIDKIILYGSRAEDRESEYSDYDILLILKQDYDWKLKKKIRNTSYDIDLNYDILTDVNVVSHNELNSINGDVPFIQNALSRGIVI